MVKLYIDRGCFLAISAAYWGRCFVFWPRKEETRRGSDTVKMLFLGELALDLHLKLHRLLENCFEIKLGGCYFEINSKLITCGRGYITVSLAGKCGSQSPVADWTEHRRCSSMLVGAASELGRCEQLI